MIYTTGLENKMIKKLSEKAKESSLINPELYTKFEVKRGLRDLDGKGVLVGLTEISKVRSYNLEDNEMIPIDGQLFYRGINIKNIVDGFIKNKRFGYEETCFLLLFGSLPTKTELEGFSELLASYRKLPEDFVLDMILKIPTNDIMNSLARSVLTFYSLDENADDTSIENVLRQCLILVACLPLMAVYGYQALAHYHGDSSLIIHNHKPELSTAQNILHMLRADSKYTELEAMLLDLALVLHAEHGGGNNSTFTTHIVTSSGADTYGVIAAALASLKGPRHGGANLKVVQMFDDIMENLSSWEDENEIEDYLLKILNKEAFDKSGLIYGIGHAVYSLSDPRVAIFKKYVARLAKDKGLENEFNLYSKVEEIAPRIISQKRKMYKGVSANVDFYSGFVYRMLNIPRELFTPLFAIARVVGWSAHRIEEIVNEGKIIRPAYKSVAKHQEYSDIETR
jgi:citrate synthase